MKIFTIYMAKNKLNQKKYIGFDSHWPNRIGIHKSSYQKQDYKFYRAIRKYGWDNFEWSIVYQSKDKHHTLKEMETIFIKEYDSFHNGYNSTLGGDGMLGFNHSNQTKTILSEQKKGKKLSEQARKNISLGHKGLKNTKETILKRIESNSQHWIVTTPDNVKMVIKNIKEFCKLNNLSQPAMSMVSSGKRNHHKGYKCKRYLNV